MNGETYYYRVYPVDTASTVGFGSLEVEAKPHSVLSTTTAPDVHIMPSAYAKSDTCQACHSSHYAASNLLQLRNAAQRSPHMPALPFPGLGAGVHGHVFSGHQPAEPVID